VPLLEPCLALLLEHAIWHIFAEYAARVCVHSSAGLLGVLEGDKELNGRWYDYSGKVVPW
jgi:hypothetical protein